MAKSVNKVILIGNLGKDPEVKHTPHTAVAKITLATNESYKDKAGQWQENRVAQRRALAAHGRNRRRVLQEGDKVYIEGRLQTRSWDDKQTNQKKYMTEVVAGTMVLLSGRGEGGGSGGHGGPRGAANHFDQRAPPEAEPAASRSPHHGRRHSFLAVGRAICPPIGLRQRSDDDNPHRRTSVCRHLPELHGKIDRNRPEGPS